MSTELQKLISLMVPKVERAFLSAVAVINDSAVEARLVAALRAGDIELALRTIAFDRAAFREYERLLISTYETAATVVTGGTVWRERGTRQRLKFRWDMSNPRASRYIQEVSSTRLVNMVDKQELMIRAAISEGYDAGQGPRSIARDLIGRVQVNGKRQGGVVGLTERQRKTRSYVKQRLLSGDYASVLKLETRNKQYDRLLQRGDKLTAAQLDRYMRVHTNKALTVRGNAIARTETAEAVEVGRYDSFNEGLGRTGYPPEAVIKTWLHGGGGMKPRDGHVAMNGVSVKGLNTAFVLPDLTYMQHTHDTAGGAKHNTNCTCDTRYEIDWSYGQ